MSLPVLRPQTFRTVLRERRIFSDTLHEYVLALPEGAAMPSRAGQFVTVEVPIAGEPAPARRPYSLVHAGESPGLTDITLCMKILPGGRASAFFAQAEIGTEITVLGAFGHFGLKPFEGERIFVATGTGIAPFVGMIEALLAAPGIPRVTLLTGDRIQSDLLYESLFADLGARIQARGGTWKLLRCLSRPGAGWSGITGRVTDVLPSLLQNPERTQVYLCGNPAMIEDATAQCVAAGLPPGQRIAEKFTSIGKTQAR